MKKLILVNGVLEYSYRVFDKARYYLYYSRHGKQWEKEIAGQCAAKLSDTGSSVIVKLHDKMFELHYDQVEHLKVLLNEYTKATNYGKITSVKISNE